MWHLNKNVINDLVLNITGCASVHTRFLLHRGDHDAKKLRLPHTWKFVLERLVEIWKRRYYYLRRNSSHRLIWGVHCKTVTSHAIMARIALGCDVWCKWEPIINFYQSRRWVLRAMNLAQHRGNDSCDKWTFPNVR